MLPESVQLSTPEKSSSKVKVLVDTNGESQSSSIGTPVTVDRLVGALGTYGND